MSDIVERLREMAGKPYKEVDRPVLTRAADRIEALETLLEAPTKEEIALYARIEALQAALQFIIDGYDNQDINHVDYRVRVYQVARAALEGK